MSDLLSIGASGRARLSDRARRPSREHRERRHRGLFAPHGQRPARSPRPACIQRGRRSATATASHVTGISRAGRRVSSRPRSASPAPICAHRDGVAWLERIEGALTGNQLGERLTGFFTSATGARRRSRRVRRARGDARSGARRGAARSAPPALRSTRRRRISTPRARQAVGSSTALGRGAGPGEQRAGAHRAGHRAPRRAARSARPAPRADERDHRYRRVARRCRARDRRVGGSDGPVLVAGDRRRHGQLCPQREGAVAFARSTGGRRRCTPDGGALAGHRRRRARIAGARAQLDTLAQGLREGRQRGPGAGPRSGRGPPASRSSRSATKPTDLTVAITDPRGIAAAGRGRARAAMAASPRSQSCASPRLRRQVDRPRHRNAAALTRRNSVADAQTAIRDSAVAARDAVTGVDLDKEAVDLIRFQQAYQASSRVIQVAREMLQIHPRHPLRPMQHLDRPVLRSAHQR